jgi:excinuclease ABC subunit A
LNGIDKIELPKARRPWKYAIEIKGARENNLKSIDVKIPLGVLSVITGVSGSGKSTLVRNILYPALSKRLGLGSDMTGRFDELSGDLDRIASIEYIDQNPIGKSSRSNPVTYVKAYDLIRQLFADQGLAKSRGYKPSFFSFNVDGGRCEECQGEVP